MAMTTDRPAGWDGDGDRGAETIASPVSSRRDDDAADDTGRGRVGDFDRGPLAHPWPVDTQPGDDHRGPGADQPRLSGWEGC